MPTTSASAIAGRAAPNSQQPIEGSRSICSIAKAIVSWVYENLIALWSRVFCCSKSASQLNANVVALQPSGAQTAQTESMGRISGLSQTFLGLSSKPNSKEPLKRTTSSSLANALAPHTAEHQWVNSTLNRAMVAIKDQLSQETNFPNKTLIAVRIQGQNGEPFLGAMNMNLTQVPKSFTWHETLHTRMRDYLIKNQVTKFEIGLCIGSDAGRGLYNVKVLQKQLGLENSSAFSSFTDSFYGGMSFKGLKLLFEENSIFQLIADRVEDILAENAGPKVW